ncbi:MAG TPA: MFS transporter [Bacillota bacterium]|nr:MFS transporter [Bacillota bacterium]
MTTQEGMQHSPKEKIWTREFVSICFANFFVFLGFQMTLPTLPIFVKEIGGNDQMIGIVVGIFTFSALLFRPYAGHALETRGRGFVYMVGIILFTIAVASYGFMTAIVGLLLMRMLHGVGFGLVSTASGTIASDLIPPSRLGEGMGYFGLSGNLALALGPALGLALVGHISFISLFLICGLLGVISFLFASRIRYKKVEKSPYKTTTMKFDVFEKAALPPAILLFFITITFGGIASFLPLLTAEKGIAGIELYFVVYALFLMVSRTFSGQIYDRKGHLFVFPPGTVLVFIAMVLLAWLPNSLTLMVAAAFYGTGFGMIQPALQAWAVSSASANRKGMANATFFSFFDLGVGIGAMVFGYIAFTFSYSAIYVASAFSVVLSILLYTVFMFRDKKKAYHAE